MISDSLNMAADTLIYNPKLVGLKPIYMPDPIPFEFITQGWFILLGIIVLLVLLLLRILFKRYQKNKYRRDAVKNLLLLKNELASESSQTIIEKVSSVLKNVSFKSYGREKTANLTSEQWHKFLIDMVKSHKDVFKVFSMFQLQYVSSQNINSEQLKQLIDASIIWVRRHRV